MIDKNLVVSVYAGVDGACCCGCKGKHSYASKFAALGGKLRGYPVTDDDISDRSVAIIVAKINSVPVEQVKWDTFGDERMAGVSIGKRYYQARFHNPGGSAAALGALSRKNVIEQ